MRRSAILFGIISAISCSAHALDIVCPQKMVTKQALLSPATDWKEFVRPDSSGIRADDSYVKSIAIYDGDPDEIAELKPDRETLNDPYWTFSESGSAGRTLYMACAYVDTRIQFVKALPPGIKKCTAKSGGVLRCEEFKRKAGPKTRASHKEGQ